MYIRMWNKEINKSQEKKNYNKQDEHEKDCLVMSWSVTKDFNSYL